MQKEVRKHLLCSPWLAPPPPLTDQMLEQPQEGWVLRALYLESCWGNDGIGVRGLSSLLKAHGRPSPGFGWLAHPGLLCDVPEKIEGSEAEALGLRP